MKSFIYFLAIVFISSSCNKQMFIRKADPIASFDWQGHRGVRGLLPENTIPAFLHALTYPQIKTLELDVVVTKDRQLVVSHEPWMSATICHFPNGEVIEEEQEKEVKIIDLSLAEIQAFDCGSKHHTDFPEQQNIPAIKPGLLDVIAAAEAEALRLKRPLPYYNIEIKSSPEWDNIFTPEPQIFAQLVVQAIQEAGVSERVTIQSFDPRSLQAVHTLAPQQDLAYLVYEKANITEQLEQLGFQPGIYSPYYKLVTAKMIKKLHQLGIKVIPWTVNETNKMERLQSMGVDGIITDYPNRILTLNRN
jgi:glycerophosphoryl diester phosphodiesterase